MGELARHAGVVEPRPFVTPAGERYLAELRQSPGASQRALLARSSTSRSELDTARRDPAFKEQEKAIRGAHQQALREAIAAAEQERAAAGLSLADFDPSISPPLAAWLAAYRETDDRLEAVRKANAAGHSLTWADVKKALAENEPFRKRFLEQWEEGVVEAEDKGLRKKARSGGFQAAKLVLEAEMPGKYGPKLAVKHQHEGVVRLELGHAPAIEAVKEDFLTRYRLPALEKPPEDIVDAEVISS